MTALEEYNLANEVVVAGDGEEALGLSLLPAKSRGAPAKIRLFCCLISNCPRWTDSRCCSSSRPGWALVCHKFGVSRDMFSPCNLPQRRHNSILVLATQNKVADRFGQLP